VAARPLWNQHSYHFTNINNDGTVPALEDDSWLTPDAEPYNSYRINPWEPLPVSAPLPDLTASRVLFQCDERVATVRIGNAGSVPVAAGVSVGFYDHAPQAGDSALGVVLTPAALAPGQFVELSLPLPGGFDLANAELHVAADDAGGLVGALVECDETNNGFSASAATACPLAFTFFPPDVSVPFGVDITDPANTGGAATAADACGNTIVVSFSDDPPAAGPPFVGVVNRTWSAGGTCGLAISAVQRITIVQRTPEPPLGLECAADVSATAVTGDGVPVDSIELPVTIVDGVEPVVLTDDRPVDFYPLGTTIVTFTAMDAIGNIATCSTRVTVDQGDSGQPAPPIETAEERRITTTTTRQGGCGFIGLFPIFACVAGLASAKLRHQHRR
jgi:hypothetical protein